VSKFELTETQFKRTVRDKIACKTDLEWENDCFKHIFEIFIKSFFFLSNNLKKH